MQVLDVCKEDYENNNIKYILYCCDELNRSWELTATNYTLDFYLFAPNTSRWSLQNFINDNIPINPSIVIQVNEPCKRKNIYGYTGDGGEYDNGFIDVYKINVNSHRIIREIETVFTNSYDSYVSFFNTNIDPIIYFMNDLKINSWINIEIPSSTFDNNFLENNNNNGNNCKLKLHYSKIQAIENNSNVNWKILSFDIECVSSDGSFPTPEKDPIVMIGNSFLHYVDGKRTIENRMFMFKEATPSDMHILDNKYDSEFEMLMNWCKYVNNCDPDIITGYNINGFDINYIVERLNKYSSSTRIGRNNRNCTTRLMTEQGSIQTGIMTTYSINCPGRIVFDMFHHIKKNYKFRSNKLGNVAIELLGNTKDTNKIDLPIKEFRQMYQNGDPDDLRTCAEYCTQDAILPILINDKVDAFLKNTMLARAYGVPISYIVNRGTQVCVFSLLLRGIADTEYILPIRCQQMTDDGYKGATVLDPIANFYRQPIVTLDYASLYPSIMIANNLCYTTIIMDDELADVFECNTSPKGFKFVTENVQPGILPTILKKLLNERKNARMQITDDVAVMGGGGGGNDLATKNAFYNNLQLALKTCANSLYGFTGATMRGILPCQEISSSVTAYGRLMLDITKKYIYEKYPGADVIYGDTDSVMIDFKCSNIAEAILIGKQAADGTSTIFKEPIKLEFEKVYCPMLLSAKKRYIGKIYDAKGNFKKIDYKGVEVARRDNCKLVGKVITKLISMIFNDDDQHKKQQQQEEDSGVVSIKNNTEMKLKHDDNDHNKPCCSKSLVEETTTTNKEEIVEKETPSQYISSVLTSLRNYTIDINDLIISVGYAKEDYKVKNPQSSIVSRLKENCGGDIEVPKVGDRIGYIIVDLPLVAEISEKTGRPLKPKPRSVSERAFLLQEYEENSHIYDVDYYINNQLHEPLRRLFSQIPSVEFELHFPSKLELRRQINFDREVELSLKRENDARIKMEKREETKRKREEKKRLKEDEKLLAKKLKLEKKITKK